MSWTKSWLDPDAETWVFGQKSSYSAAQGRAEQSRAEQSRAEQEHSLLSKPSPTYSSETPQALGSIGE